MNSTYKAAISELDSSWVLEECGSSNFGDERLNNRLKTTLSRMSCQPTAPLNQSCESLGETLGAYRFIDNNKVSPDKILESHAKQASERAKNEAVVLCIQDTSSIKLNSHPSCEGLGYIGRETLKGLFLYSVFSILPSGIPLGVLTASFSTRKEITRKSSHERSSTLIEEKESFRWLDSAKKTKGLFLPETMVVHVCDREADIFEFYSCINAQDDYFLVRAKTDRRIDDGENLYQELDFEPSHARVVYEIPSKGGRSKRKAKLDVKYIETTLKAPEQRGLNRTKSLEPIEVWCIEVKELNPPENESAVCWRLLTNVPVENVEEALEKVQWYSKRWAIEEIHKILKSCCRVEKAQFETVKRLSNYITLRSIVAWRIYYLVHMARVEPKASANLVLTKSEIETLELLANNKSGTEKRKRLLKIKTVKQALMEVAKLGGHLDRKNDPSPGITVIWRGINALAFANQGVLAARAQTYV